MIHLSTFLLLLPLIFARPLLERSTSVTCGQWGEISAGSYILYNNLWGESGATSGSQCTTLDSSGSTVKWSTKWTWTGGSGIKSYPNVGLNGEINKQLSAITSMPSTWSWSYAYSGTLVADVAYDLFTSSTAGGSGENEIMIWLASYNSGAISYKYNQYGKAVPIQKSLSIAGHEWNLYEGSNGYNKVYSFLPASGSIATFDGDIYEFFSHLVHKGYISGSQYLVTAGAGTEATSGSATFETSQYSLTVN